MASHSTTLNTPTYNNDPLTYCLGNDISQRFNHSSNADVYGQNSKACQAFLSSRCTKNWDGICEYATDPTTNEEYKYRANPLSINDGSSCPTTNSADILLLNTARIKYLVGMKNCSMVTEPFDPLVPASPTISYWQSSGGRCVPYYAVDARNIDYDPVMNKLLDKPWIAHDLFINIARTMKRMGTLGGLRGTRLGRYLGV